MILRSGTLFFFSFLSLNRKGVDWLILRLLNSRKEIQDFLANQREGKNWLSKEHYGVICCFWTQSFNLYLPFILHYHIRENKMNSKLPFLPELWCSVKAKLSANSPSLIRGRGGRVGSIFCPQWNLSFGTAPFEGHKIWCWKNVHIVFVFVVLYWRDSFIQGKGTLFLGPETWL